MESRPLAIATCRAFPALYAEEQRIVTGLAERGIVAAPVVWNDPEVEWGRFAAVVVRSIWDYFQHYPAFLAWLNRLERERVRLLNPVALVRWNADKHYLSDLEKAGVPIVPTAILEPTTGGSLAALLQERGWDRVVVKPAVSGNAERTQVVTRATVADHEGELARQRAAGGALLVQPFAPEIQAEGEWSLLFFGSRFSHAVLKRPAAGDFRVQLSYGGSATRIEPPAALLRSAQAVVEALPEPPLYVRIDGLRRGETFLLMEAEAIEPYLYFDQAPEQIGAFVEALARAR